MVHQTNTMNKVKALRQEAKEKEAALAAAQKLRAYPGVQAMLPELRELMELAQAEAARLKDSGMARLEDLHIFEVQKVSKKGNKTHSYWHASWMVGKGRYKNVYLGSCKKMSHSEATLKARKMKAASLGIDENLPQEPSEI